MRSQVLLVAGAAVAVANPLAEIHQKRQAEIGEECQAALGESMEVIQTLPEPPTDPEFLAFLGEQEGGPVGECEIPSVTGDADQASTYSSWASEMTEWIEDNGSVLLNFLSACATEPLVSSAIAEIQLPIETGSICSEYNFAGAADATTTGDAPSATETGADAETTTDGGDDAEETGTDSEESSAVPSDDAEESESESPAAAPRQTGMAVAAMAVAGFAVAGIY